MTENPGRSADVTADPTETGTLPPRARTVVVCGVGAVTSLGEGADALWEGVRAGRAAITPVRGMPMDGYATAIGGEVLDDTRPAYDYLAAFGGQEREPAVEFALRAAQEATAQAGFSEVSADRFGVAFGSCNGGLRSAEKIARRKLDGTSPEQDGLHYLLVPPQAIADALSGAFGLRGPALSVNTACASGAHAIAHAATLISTGRADVMLAGGADAFTETAFAGFTSLQSLSTKPAAPYSKDRDGLSLGEGAGMLVLAEESVALAAGAPILAVVLGYGLSADGYHATAPHPEGEGAARAIRGALRAAGINPEDVSYINGHGTGTPKNDSAESNAVRAAFGEAAETTALSSSKSMIGHLLGAAGAVEAVVTIKAVAEQTAPPTANFTEIDPKCGLDAVPGSGRRQAMDVALSNNFAFAGANACVAFGRPGAQHSGDRPQPAEDRVVVTGVAAVTPAGWGPQAAWQAWQDGAAFGAEEDGLRVARADFAAQDHIAARDRRRMDRLGQLAVAVSRAALEDAGLTADERVGVVLGTGLGPMRSIEDFLSPVLGGEPADGSPAIFPNTVFNAAAGQVAMQVGAKGPTSTVTTGHAAGASALAVSFDLLRQHCADAIVCPAVEDLSPGVLEAYRALPLFADGQAVLSEGGIALVLERESTARARGARVLAEFAGHATASDALGIGRWSADGEGVERAMRGALEHAGVAVDELGGLWANAAGLELADAAEAKATARLSVPASVPVHAPRTGFGEPVGAGAHLSALLAVTGWRQGGADGPALINSSSLGGTHISLVLRPPTEN